VASFFISRVDTEVDARLDRLGTPEAGPTLEAFADHGQVSGDMTGSYDDSHRLLTRLAAAGIDFDDVTAFLERDGLDKFEKSRGGLGATVAAEMERHHP